MTLRATLGVNDKIQGLSLEPFLAWNARAKPEVNISIDEPKSAAAQLAQGTRVIYRWSGDDHAHENHDARAFVRRLHNEAPAGCILQLGNEPGRESLERLNNWSLDALDECERLGRIGSLFGFATGEPEPEDWRVVRPSVIQAKRKGHWVNVHQYFNRTVAQSIPWHINRHLDIYREFGADTPQLVIGELGCAVDYDPHAGWVGALSIPAFLAELGAAQREYVKHGIPSCIYLWGLWDRSPRFRIQDFPELLDGIVQLNATIGAGEGEEMAVPGYVRVTTKQAGATVNVRAAASISAPIVTTVKTGDWAKRLGAAVKNGAYTWQPVVVDKTETTHVHGYVALEVIEV